MNLTKMKLFLKNTIEYFDITVSLLVLVIFTYNILISSYVFYITKN